MALDVPIPQFLTDPPGGTPELEKPLQLRIGRVRYPDGSDVAANDVRKLGVFVYRAAGAGDEIWNESEQRWQAAPASEADLAPLTPVPLGAKAGDPLPWQGVLVAIGQKDKAGADRFASAVNGTPRYRLRAYASASREGVASAGVSGPSADFTFVSAAAKQRFSVTLDPAKPEDTTRVRLALKNAALSIAGYVEIRASGGQEVEIANCDGSGAVLARVLLTSGGDIRLVPRAGRAVVIAGPLEAEEIHYRPQGQAAKQYL
jgi:hypothetical protein